MKTRERFVERFGEHDATIIEEAANQHRNEEPNAWTMIAELISGKQIEVADDQFLLDIATCIARECVTRFRESHGFQASEDELREWIANNANPPPAYRDPAWNKYSEYLGEM